jgi:FtsH-binding integral membrane protein
MNKLTSRLYYINVTLCTIGIIFSFYVLGWIEHENHTLIGSTCFVVFLGLLLGSVINYNKASNRTKD